MKFNKFIQYILFILIIICYKSSKGQRPYVVDFHSLDYDYNKERFKLFDLKIHQYRGNNALNVTVIFAQDINDFYLDFQILVPRNKRRPFVLFNATANGCEFLNGSNNKSLKYAYMAHNQIKEFKNFPKKCPVEKDKSIYITNFYYDSKKSPLYLPVFDFRFSVASRQKDVFLFRIHFNLRMKNKKSN